MTNNQARGGLSGGAEEMEDGSKKSEAVCWELDSTCMSATTELGTEAVAASRQPAAIIPSGMPDGPEPSSGAFEP